MGQNDRGFLMKTYGGQKPQKKYPLSEKNAQSWPELEQTLASIAATQGVPDANNIRPMNWFERMISGNAHGMTNPVTGTVSLNRNVIGEDNADLSSVLSHELKHAEQRKRKGILGTLFGNREALEREAYSSEIPKKYSRDIRLR